MVRKPIEPFVKIGTAPYISDKGDIIALSPIEPHIVESGRQGEQHFLRIANYKTQEIVVTVPISDYPSLLSFSPNGKLFFAKISRELLIFSNKGTLLFRVNPKIIIDDGAWLNDQEILLAGIYIDTKYPGPKKHKSWVFDFKRHKYKLCIGILEFEAGQLRIVYQEKVLSSISYRLETSDSGFSVSTKCLPSGVVALGIKYQGSVIKNDSSRKYYQIALYQLDEDRNAVLPEPPFYASDTQHKRPPFFSWDNGSIAVAEDGQTILNVLTNRINESLVATLFGRHGHRLYTLEFEDFEWYQNRQQGLIKYQQGCVCLCGVHKVQIYRAHNSKLYLWCSRNVDGRNCDLTTKNGKTLLAVQEKNQTIVFELKDFYILQLVSEDVEKRCKAAQNLGQRRFHPAVQHLIPLLWDESPDVQRTVIDALAEIGDSEALPQMIRVLGHKSGERFRGDLTSALRRFSAKQLISAVLDCIARPGVAFRLGAMLVLECIPSIETLEAWLEAIHDVDHRIRLSAAHALRKRADMRACVALMAHLNDENDDVRTAVQQALTTILKVNNLLSNQVSEHLFIPMDVASYAQDVISLGRMHEFEDFGNPTVSSFLTGLASASVQSDQPLPQILNAIEALTTMHEHSPEEISVSIALMMALICADAMRAKQKWQETIGICRNTIMLAKQIEAPQIEWRAWYAIGECFETLGNDSTALNAFRHAMEVIDRLWFALLEEDKLRDFFQDKALLYDRAGLCCLRLGHTAMALECCEKAKTRYLGDLIARRQMNPQVALNQELREFWKDIGSCRPIKVSVGTSAKIGKDQVEIVAIQSGEREIGAGVIKPKCLAAFEEACQNNPGLQRTRRIVDMLWQLMAHIATLDDEEIHESVEAIYQALLPIYQAVKTESLPIPLPDQQLILSQFHDAACALSHAGRSSRDAPFWLFSEFDPHWLEDICNLTETDETALLLEAVMEALNTVLHHEPILGIPVDEPFEEEREGPVFVTRPLSKESTSLSRGTTIIETALERYAQTRWRYITRLARGEISNYQDIANSLSGQPDVAQLQFTITEHGTVIYITYGTESTEQQPQMLPDFRGEENFYIFTCLEVTLSSLRKFLLQDEDSWFALYHRQRQDDGLQAWMKAMDKTLQWLYSHLIAPIDAHLKSKGVRVLRIIPHRALHLIPFSAMYYTEHNGKRHYLGDDYDIEYAPSATLQQICRERAQNRTLQQSLTAISNPTEDLPFATAEVDQIITYFPASGVQVFRDCEARREAITTSTIGSVLHFSGHGKYDWDDPLSSHLLFVGNEPLELADLFAEEISLFQTTLVVLSACETNITNPEVLADEYLGIASGFLFAGTPTVISTLWAIDDLSSALLLSRWYGNVLQKKMNKAAALRDAQLWARDLTYAEVLECLKQEHFKQHVPREIIRSYKLRCANQPDGKPFEHPYYWGAFTCNGSWK